MFLRVTWFQVPRGCSQTPTVAFSMLWSCVSSTAVSRGQLKPWEKWLSLPKVSQDSLTWISTTKWEATHIFFQLYVFHKPLRWFCCWLLTVYYIGNNSSDNVSSFLPFAGNFAEVRRDRDLNHHDGAPDEQRRHPHIVRTDLHDAGVPQESQKTLRSDDGAQVRVLSQVQHAGAGRQRHGPVSGCHYPQRGWALSFMMSLFMRDGFRVREH